MTKIGEGAFGVVYKTKWRGSIVAVKQMKSTVFNSKRRQEFVEECEFMRNLQPHPSVVQFLGICEDPICMITEYCGNGSLKSLLDSNKPIDSKLQFKIISNIVSGMYHLENEKIIHRDLAARNCLLTENYDTKVADFGLSKIAGATFSDSDYGNWPLKWLSPETLETRNFDSKTDVWSFGVLMIEVLTRKDPYPNYSVDMFAKNLFTQNLTSTIRNQIPNDAPPLLKKIAFECLDKDPTKRPVFSIIYNHLDKPILR